MAKNSANIERSIKSVLKWRRANSDCLTSTSIPMTPRQPWIYLVPPNKTSYLLGNKYHKGYQSQVGKWPLDPVRFIAEFLLKNQCLI